MDYFDCQHCGDLVSIDPMPNPLTCVTCQEEIAADRKYDETKGEFENESNSRRS